MIGTALHLH